MGTTKLTPGSIPPFLDCQIDLEHAEFAYEQLIELALDFKSVEAFFLYFISEGYLTKSDYVLNKAEVKWFLEFDLLTSVLSQKVKLEHWSKHWELFRKCQKFFL